MGSDGHVPAYPGPSDHCGYCGRMCLVGEACPARVERAHCVAMADGYFHRSGEGRWTCADPESLADLIARERAAARAAALEEAAVAASGECGDGRFCVSAIRALGKEQG